MLIVPLFVPLACKSVLFSFVLMVMTSFDLVTD